MSRSYKHSPVWTDPCGDRRFEKNYANRRVRRRKEILQFSAYKRLTSSWRIIECRFYRTKQQYLAEWIKEAIRHGESLSSENVISGWFKSYHWK